MCGIIGCFRPCPDKEVSPDLTWLSHRGPDDHGIYQADHVWLGHTRLSIIDLSDAAHQPMVDEGGRYCIVFNGEIYNFRELRKELEARGGIFRSDSDTEVVLKAYIEFGIESFAKLRGMFALAIYDRDRREIVLARDRLGIKPLLYSELSDGVVFSSELKALLGQGLVGKKLAPDSLYDLFAYGSVRQPNTILEGVRHLMPGQYMIADANGGKTVRSYTDPFYNVTPRVDLSYEEAVVELRSRLEEATRYHLVSDVEVGCFLSGGVDSTSVLALMSRLVSRPIKSFSIGFESQSEVTDESRLAERTASVLGSDFTRAVVSGEQVAEDFSDFVRSIDQPSIDGFNTYLVSKVASREVKVSLSGLGGDEIFAGYPHYGWLPEQCGKDPGPAHSAARFLHSRLPNRFSLREIIKGCYPAAALGEVRTVFYPGERVAALRAFGDTCPPDLRETGSFLRGLSLAEINGYLRDTLLRDADAVSMWHSLEVRPVLLDGPLVEFALSLPDEFKVRHGQLKSVFVDAVKDLIPGEVWQREKTGFEIPFACWMNGALNQQIGDILHSAAAEALFQGEWLRKLQSRALRKKMIRRDWLPVVLTSWCVEYGIYR